MIFKGKTVLITGAGSGIGRTAAISFAKEGAAVIVSDINDKGGNETVDQVIDNGGNAVFIKADVSNFDDQEQLVKAVLYRHEKIDIAINNAGILGLPVKTEEVPLEDYDRVMAINASGVFYGMKLQIPVMKKQGQGVILNVSSVAGLRGLPNNLAYSASKHAVVGMTRTAAMECARHKIRINAICPVFTLTPMFNPEKADEFSPGLSEKLKANVPMKRFADAQEIADVMIWLCSDKASFITGQAIPVDGGATA